MILIAMLVGNFAFAQQKVLTEKDKLLIEKGQVKMPEASFNAKSYTKAPANSVSLNRQVKNKNRGSAYAVDALSGNVVSFDLATPGSFTTIATLTLVGDNFICAGSWANNTWYVSEYGANTLGTLDVSDGTYTVVGPFGVGINAMAYDNATNTMYGAGYDGAANSQLYTIDLSTGAATLVGNAGAGIIIGMACDASGILYAAFLDDNLYTVDKATGASTVIGPLGMDINYSQDLEYDNENDIMYLAGYTTNASLYTIDPATGTATLAGDFPASTELCGFAVPYNAVTYTNDIALQSIISPATGPNLTANEIVTVRVKNNGTATQSNIAVSYTINGGTAVNEVVAGPLAADAYIDYTFTQTADLSVVQSYEIVAMAAITGDENPGNDSKTKTVINQGNMILMQNGSFTSCSGTFYDTGGPDGTYQSNENITMTIAPTTPGAKMMFNFTAFECENTYDFLNVYDGVDMSAPLIGSFTGVSIPSELIELVASAANASGAITFNFTSDGSVVKTGWAATVSCFTPSDHDMAATVVSGNTTPTSGTVANYTVTVTNVGSSAELGSGYTVALYDANDVMIGTAANGGDIIVGASLPFVFPWTPGPAGPTFVYGKVTLTGDMNPANDQTPDFGVIIQPEGVIVTTIGTGTELFGTPRTPFDFYWKNSLCESLYFPDEILQPAGTQITQVAYQNNFVSNLTDKPVKIFMGETSLEDLSGGWVSANDLTLVFDGMVSFPSGMNEIIIPLNIPYTYNGGNLVIMTNRPMDTEYFNTNDKYYSTTSTTHPNRTMGAGSDATLYDPYAPPSGTTALSYFPNTMLYMLPGGPTSIYETDFEAFTSGGQVACQDPINWSTWSNAPCGTEDPFISTDFAHSGVNSAKDTGANDLIFPMGNKTSGEYNFEFWMYIPAGHGGYYNLLQNFATGNYKWGFEFVFTDAGTANFTAGGVTIPVPYLHDQWIKVTNIIDLDNDMAEVLLDGVSVHSWQWSLGATGTGGINQLAAANFFSGSGAPGIVSPLYYIDDLVFSEAAPNGFDATFTVSNAIPALVEGAAIMVKKGGLTYNGITNASGVYTFPALYAGTYNYTVSMAGFTTQTGTFTGDATNLAISVTLLEDIVTPFGLAITYAGPDAIFSWNNSTGFSDDFESYPDFSLTFDPWILNDVDGGATYGFTGISFPNSGAPMAGIIFNPSATNPVLEVSAHSGSKFIAIFNTTLLLDDDWVIAPMTQISAGDQVSFFAKAFDPSYVSEKFQVFVSTTGTAPADFTALGPLVTCTDTSWHEYSYSLASYAGQNVYIGIQCTSADQFILFIDDFSISQAKSRAFIGYNVYLDNMTTPVATNVSATNYTFIAPAQGAHTAGVSATYTTGTTPIVTIDWTFNVDIKPVANSNINIYPNPTKGNFSIENLDDASIYITNIMGNVIAAKESVTGSTSFDLSGVAKGMYLVKIVSDNKVITKRINVIN